MRDQDSSFPCSCLYCGMQFIIQITIVPILQELKYYQWQTSDMVDGNNPLCNSFRCLNLHIYLSYWCNGSIIRIVLWGRGLECSTKHVKIIILRLTLEFWWTLSQMVNKSLKGFSSSSLHLFISSFFIWSWGNVNYANVFTILSYDSFLLFVYGYWVWFHFEYNG